MCDDICFFQAEDGIRDLVRSRGLGDVYKRQEGIVAEDGEGVAVVTVEAVLGRHPEEAPRVLEELSLIHI